MQPCRSPKNLSAGWWSYVRVVMGTQSSINQDGDAELIRRPYPQSR